MSGIPVARPPTSMRRAPWSAEMRRTPCWAPSAEILAVHDALDALAAEDPLSAEVVKLRYFVGMRIPEIADALGIAARTADRHWAFARAWLKQAIEGQRRG